jgi:lipid-A-disaccharide synthase-like uncharacterized protein
MRTAILQSLGLIGTAIYVSAYLPQIIHLLRVKNSTGISIPSWIIWSVGALMLFSYAIYQKDAIFILLTTLEFLSLVTGIILAIRYKQK